MPDPSGFAERLAQLGRKYPQHDPDLVAEMVSAVLKTMRGDLSGMEAALLVEIQELAQAVATARAEIAALGADDITGSHIPSATDELDAIVAHTAAATEDILECCEQLDVISPRLSSEDAGVVQAVVTRIYEACSFQDITGQRITKVVATLKAIETKVARMMEAFGPDGAGTRRPAVPVQASADQSSLLNGPQLPAAAMDQSDIDALLASFD